MKPTLRQARVNPPEDEKIIGGPSSREAEKKRIRKFEKLFKDLK